MELSDLINCGKKINLKYHGKHKAYFEGKIFSIENETIEIGISLFDEDVVSSKYNKRKKSLDIYYKHYSGIRIAILPIKKFFVPGEIMQINIFDK